jgi:hypothetical protein
LRVVGVTWLRVVGVTWLRVTPTTTRPGDPQQDGEERADVVVSPARLEAPVKDQVVRVAIQDDPPSIVPE